MNAHQRRIADRALYRLMLSRTVVSWRSWRPRGPREYGRVVGVNFGGTAAEALSFDPQNDHDPHERVTLKRLRVHRDLPARPIRYAATEPGDCGLPAEPCPVCGGDGMDDDVTPCEHCDGEGYEWWN
jgi:hypothetical protein